MLGRTHALSGAAAWLAVSPLLDLPPEQLVVGTAVGAVGALVPDLDEPGAHLSRVLGPLRHSVCGTIRRVSGGHRHGTHYLLTALVVGGLLRLWHPWIGDAVAVGMIAHSLGDMCTVAGVRWLWPLPFRIRGLLQTGGFWEKAAVAPALTMVLVWLGWRQLDAPLHHVVSVLAS